MDQKLGLELSDDELEDFQKLPITKSFSRALTITNDDDMDAIIDDREDKNFSIQQENERTQSESIKQKKKEKKKKQT